MVGKNKHSEKQPLCDKKNPGNKTHTADKNQTKKPKTLQKEKTQADIHEKNANEIQPVKKTQNNTPKQKQKRKEENARTIYRETGG